MRELTDKEIKVHRKEAMRIFNISYSILSRLYSADERELKDRSRMCESIEQYRKRVEDTQYNVIRIIQNYIKDHPTKYSL